MCPLPVHAQKRNWGDRWDSNPRRPESQSGALPTELRSPYSDSQIVNYPTIQDVKASESSYSRDHVAKLARPTGLEPVTYGLEGRCSIRLSYGRRHVQASEMVGAEGFEPPTPCSQSRCATRLRHAPTVGGYPRPDNNSTGSWFIKRAMRRHSLNRLLSFRRGPRG